MSLNGRKRSIAGKRLCTWRPTYLFLIHPPPEFHITVTERKGWGVKPEEIRVPIDQEEIEAISTCRATDVAEWIKILDWGQRTGGLDVSQRQIISSLRLLLPGVGKRTRQEKMRGKVGESSFGHVNRVRFEETSA